MPSRIPNVEHRPSFWFRLLTSGLPIPGNSLRLLGLEHLMDRIRSGDRHAVHEIFLALRSHLPDQVQNSALQALSNPLPGPCLDRLWEEWADFRLPELEVVFTQLAKPASRHSTAWALSLAFLNQQSQLQQVPPAKIAAAAELLTDRSPQITSAARQALAALPSQESINALFQYWSEVRSPQLWELIRSAGYTCTAPVEVQALAWLKLANASILADCTAAMIPFLIAALRDKDPSIAEQARLSLPGLKNPEAVDALCHLWQEKRLPVLAQIMRQGRLVASSPTKLRFLSALKVSRLDIARQCSAPGIPDLCSLLNDSDPDIAAACQAAISTLELPDSQDALCVFAIHQGHTQALQLAVQAGFRPIKPEQRALFLFLTGQWAEYDALDFDLRLMSTIYATSRPEIRQRILLQVQQSGRETYVAILEGSHFRATADRLSSGEVDLLVNLLIENQDWDRLWSLVPELAFPWGVKILQQLGSTNWQPDSEQARVLFANACELAKSIHLPAEADFVRSIPMAVARAVVRVPGRVNAVCFAPKLPLLAIGTGSRKLALWDFQKAALQQVRAGFNHSISEVTFAGEQTLLCGIRSNRNSACWIYGWQGEDAFVLPGHRGAVSSLQPVDANRLLSSGRDGAVILWDLASRSQVNRCDMPDWPRYTRIAPGGQRVLILHNSISLLPLPELTIPPFTYIQTVRNTRTSRSVGQCAAFAPDSSYFLVGQANGQVVHYQPKENEAGFTRKAVFRSPGAITGLEYIAQRACFAISTSRGRIDFCRASDLQLLGSLAAPHDQVTSLHISPDGNFMATGTNHSAMILWDLRAQDLAALYSLPLAAANLEHLASVLGLLESTDLPAPLLPVLQLLKLLLQQRFRFDIHIDELPQIQPGEFDILLE